MDSTQDLFTRRMLRRASVRKNRGGGNPPPSGSDDSRRISSILQAIDDQPIKIADVADDRGASDIKGRGTSDVPIPRRRDPPDVNRINQRISSHLIGHSIVDADCENTRDSRKHSADDRTSESRPSPGAKIIERIPACEKRGIAAADAGFPAGKSKVDESPSDGERCGYNEKVNVSDLTRTLNSTSMNGTGSATNYVLRRTPTYVKGFELGNVKWRGPLYTACVSNKMRRKRDDGFAEWSLDVEERTEPSGGLRTSEEPELVTAVRSEILPPPMMRAELKRIGNFKQGGISDGVESSRSATGANKRPDKLSLSRNVGENSDSTAVTPLTAEIKQLDADILHLDFHPSFRTTENAVDSSPTDRIYPNLSKIEFSPTGYRPEILDQSPRSPGTLFFATDNRPNPNEHIASSATGTNTAREIRTVNSNGTIPETGNTERDNGERENGKFNPNLESTRRSTLTDASKDTGYSRNRESITTISSVASPATSPTNVGNAGTSSTPNEKTIDSTVPYDVENFLADALGDELYNTTVTYPPSETHDKSISQFNASELISEERTPVRRRLKTFLKKAPMTEPPPRHTGTFDRTMTIYRSLTQRIKNKLRPGLRSMPKIVANDVEPTAGTMSEDKKIRALLLEADIQHTLMYQANKALTLCRSTKEFFASTEQVEFERLLLVSELRKTAALEEIRKLQDCELNNNDQRSSCESGEVTVRDLSLALKENVTDDESRHGDFVQWFVVAVSHRETVWATRPISCPVQSPRIIFPDEFSVPNLTPNFRITLGIYSLKLRRATFSHEDKYRLNRYEKHSRCPSPKKLRLRRADRSFTAIRNSSFVLSGTLELFLHDLTLASPWPLTSLAPGSVLHGTIDLTLSCQLRLSVSHSGFVTYGEEAGGLAAWNRRWCLLQGRTLMFWNYPCDQEDKDPIAAVDLASCVSSEITLVDRSLCAKARTLLIETARRRDISDRNSLLLECRSSCTIIRKLLCCDTVEDLNQWKSKLNRVITALRDWNVVGRPSHEQVSDL